MLCCGGDTLKHITYAPHRPGELSSVYGLDSWMLRSQLELGGSEGVEHGESLPRCCVINWPCCIWVANQVAEWRQPFNPILPTLFPFPFPFSFPLQWFHITIAATIEFCCSVILLPPASLKSLRGERTVKWGREGNSSTAIG